MINILFNRMNFDESWASDSMVEYIHPEDTVTILPIGTSDMYASDVSLWQETLNGSEDYEDLLRPFQSYGVRHIQVLNYMNHSPEYMMKVMENTDILVLVAGSAESAMNTIYDFELSTIIRHFRKTLIGIHAGALLQMDEFYENYDYQEGLGLLDGFDLISDYEEEPEQLERIRTSIESRDKNVIALPPQAGVIIDDKKSIEILGNAFIAKEEDLDNIYKAIQEL